MTIEKKVAKIFNLTPNNWMKHSNPWSVWTRYSVLPIIAFAIWSRVWLGWWSLIPGIISILWMFFNPILFKQPKSTKNWASKSVMGERVYLNKNKIDIPEIHKKPILKILNILSSMGLMIAIWGAITYTIWVAISGICLAYLSESWYLDRMVWIYEDMKDHNQAYKSWDY